MKKSIIIAVTQTKADFPPNLASQAAITTRADNGQALSNPTESYKSRVIAQLDVPRIQRAPVT